MRMEPAESLGVRRTDQLRDREKREVMKLESTLPMGSFVATADQSPRSYHWAQASAQSGRSRKVWNLVVSALVHGVAIVAMMIVGLISEPEELPTPPESKIDMVLVRMPTPEPPGSQSGGGPGDSKEMVARPKTLARRSFAANVSQFKSSPQQQVTQVAATPVFGDVKRIEVQPINRTQAPKALTQRQVAASTVQPLEVAQTQQATAVPTETPTLRQAPTVGQQSAGPRIVDAAGPITRSDAIDYQQATIADGVADSVTVAGDSNGPKIRSLQSGSGSLYGAGLGRGNGTGSGGGNGTGDGIGNGTGSGIGDGSGSGGGVRECSADPACLQYLEMIRQRVYTRWNPSKEVPVGKVRMSFRIDKSGSAHGIELVSTENKPLGESCMQAFRHASPFPPPPASIAYIFNKKLVATFDIGERR